MALTLGALFFPLAVGLVFNKTAAADFPMIRTGLPIAAVIALLPIMFLGCRWAECTWKEFPKMSCIHCDDNLFQRWSLVVATGNCPHCGRRALKDELIGN